MKISVEDAHRGIETCLEELIAEGQVLEARVIELEKENALLKRALAMLTRSLENANEGGDY